MNLDKVTDKLMASIGNVPPVRELNHINTHTDFKDDYRKIEPVETNTPMGRKYQGRVRDSYI